MSEDTNGLTVLSIDGASMHQSGVIPPLLILQEIASRYENDKKSPPGSFRARKTFQMIGGVGDGGLLAFMLGHFGMSVNDAIREYRHILKAVHQHSDATRWSKNERSQQFETALKAFVASKTNPRDENYPLIKPKEENPRCKVFVTAMHALNLQHPILLRTYRSRIDSDPPKCTVVEAIRATTAMPDLFTPVTLGPPHRQIDYFSPACHGFNNPIDQARQEVKAAFPDRSISCIISLGCGHPGPVQIKDATEDAARAVVQLAMDSVRAAEQTYRRLAGIPNLYFRFDVPYGLERAVLKLNPTLSEIQAHIRAYVGQEQTSDRINSAVKQLVERPTSIEASELDGILPVEATATVWVRKCPLPSPNFTGRRDELDHMHAYFSSSVGSSSHLYVIYGLGGSGKSQLLFQFVLECQTRSPRTFDIVYFVDASLETTVEADLKAIAIDRKVGETAADAVQWLSCQSTRWLLVFDNADDKSFSIQKYIPKSIHGSVIITSRNPELTGLTSKDSGSRRIEDLEKRAAETLLRKLVGSRGTTSNGEDSLVTQVAEMLHCFALAITQAGSYMSATGRGYQEYIELFEVERTRLLRERKGLVPDNYPWSVYTTWAISFDQLKTASRHFMQICSYLHHTGIPKDLFKRAAESQPLSDVDEGPQIWLSEFMNHTRNNGGRWNPVAFDEIIQNTMSFSLIGYDSETRMFSFHPLVHDWTREAIRFTHGQEFPDVQCALQLVALSTPRRDDNTSASVFLKRHLQSHLDSLVSGAVHISSVPMAVCLAAVYDQNSRWNDVANIFERAQENCQYANGWNIDICTGNRATAYLQLGRYAEALDLQLSTTANQKRTLGNEHPETLKGMNNLGLMYQALGRHAETLELQLTVHANSKRILGDEHPDTLMSINNLASTYSYLGRPAEALELQLSLLATQKLTLGDEHPDTLKNMSNLAMTYIALGQHAEALEVQLSVLANQQRILGDEHLQTLTSMNNLGITYQHLGRHAEALELQLQELAFRKRILGDEHPETLRSMNNIGMSYQHLGRHAEALDLHLTVLADAKRTLGDEHPFTLANMNNLALLYNDLGRHAEALDVQLSVVASQKQALGDEHSLTLTSMNNLAMTYTDLGRHEEALDLQCSVLARRKRILGDEHPDALASMDNLASIYLALGRQAEAIDLLIPAADVALRALGAEHPTTLSLQQSLDGCLSLDSGEPDNNSFVAELDAINETIKQYEQEERWEDAIEQGEIAVETSSAILGEHHSKTLLFVFSLAKNCRRLGRTNDERHYIERMYRIVKDVNFPSEGCPNEVQMVEELYSRTFLGTTAQAQLNSAEPPMDIVTVEPEREMAVTLTPRIEDGRSTQVKAADAAEARRKALDKQLKDKEEVKDNKTASSSKPIMRTEISQNASVAPPVTNLVNAPKMSQPPSHAPKRSQETNRKGKARNLSSPPNDQNEQTAPVTTTTRVDDTSVEQQNIEAPSSTLETKQYAVTNKAHTHPTRTVDPPELDASISSHTAVVSTSSTLLPAETKVQTRELEIAHNPMSVPHINDTPSENGAHERYMASMELKKMKMKAKSGKQERQCRLEMARMILFALVILGIQWRDTKRSGDE